MAPRRRSAVWSFCRRLADQRVQCLLCSASFTNSSNMLKHLRAKHPAQFSAAEDSTAEFSTAEDSTAEEQHMMAPDDCSVEVELENCERVSAVNEADMTCAAAVDSLLAAEGDVSEEQRHRVDAGGDVSEEQRHRGDAGGDVSEEQRHRGDAGGDGPPSTRKWSSIWMHYEYLEQQKCALCLLCMEKLYHHSSTSNLHRHLSKRHPEVFARIIKKRPPKAAQSTPSKAGAARLSKKITVKERFSDVFEMLGAREGEVRVLERERELTEALRNAQKQEGRALEQQKELLDMMQRANAREMAAERRVQEHEAGDLARQREELQKEREGLQKEREELQKEREGLQMEREGLHREREELQYLSNSQPAD